MTIDDLFKSVNEKMEKAIAIITKKTIKPIEVAAKTPNASSILFTPLY